MSALRKLFEVFALTALLPALLAVSAWMGADGTAQASPAVHPSIRLTAKAAQPTLPAPNTVSGLCIEDSFMLAANPASIGKRMAQISRDLGVHCIRMHLHWREVLESGWLAHPLAPDNTQRQPVNPRNPNDPAYNWKRYDLIVDNAARYGISVIFVITNPPVWAKDDPTQPGAWYPNIDQYGDFVSAAAHHFNSATPDLRGVKHNRVGIWEAYNEPNFSYFLEPQWRTVRNRRTGKLSWTPLSPAIYAGLLTRAYQEIHRVQKPDAVVVGLTIGGSDSDIMPGDPSNKTPIGPAEGTMSATTFINTLIPLHPPMDAVSFHLYPCVGPQDSTPALMSYSHYTDLLGALGQLAPGKPVFVSEFGWITVPSDYHKCSVSPDQQGVYLQQAAASFAQHPEIKLASMYQYQDNGAWNSGVVNTDGTIKTSYQAFAAIPKNVP